MKPTRTSGLVLLAAAAAVCGYLLAVLAYFDLSPLPVLAPVTLILLAVVELGMARVVRDRLRGPRARRARTLHPMQVARAAVLAKASSPTGALLLGGYAGLLAWTVRRRGALRTADRDALIAGLSCLAAFALVAAALWLERSCRTPERPDTAERLSSRG